MPISKGLPTLPKLSKSMFPLKKKWAGRIRTGPLERRENMIENRCLLPACYVETNECCGIISLLPDESQLRFPDLIP